MTQDDRELGKLMANAESRRAGERDLWQALHERDATISDLKQRMTIIEAEKRFAGFIVRALWTSLGGGAVWIVQHFGLPTPKP